MPCQPSGGGGSPRPGRQASPVHTHLVDFRQGLDLGPVQDTQRQADHLQVLAAGGGGDVARLGAHIVVDGALQPRHQEVGALADNVLLHTRQTVEDDGPRPAADIVDGVLQHADADGGGHGKLGEEVQNAGVHGGQAERPGKQTGGRSVDGGRGGGMALCSTAMSSGRRGFRFRSCDNPIDKLSFSSVGASLRSIYIVASDQSAP